MKGFNAKVLAVLLIVAGNQSHAQYSKKQIDSILDVVSHTNNLETGIDMGEKAYDAAAAIHYTEGMVRARLSRASKYANASHFDEAFKAAVAAEGITVKLNNPRYIAVLETIKGRCYSRLGFHKEAGETLVHALSIAQKIKDADQRHNRLGNIYDVLAENHQLLKQDAKALPLRRKAYVEYVKIKDKYKFPNIASLPLCNLADNFLTLKQFDSAEFYFKKAAIVSEENHENFIKGATFNALGELYYQQKKYRAAEVSYKNAVDAFAESKDTRMLKNAYIGLSKVYTALNEKTKVQQYLKRSVELSDSIANVEKYAIKGPLNYIIKQKEQQLAENRNRNFRIILVISFLLIIAICAIVFFLYKYKEKLQLNNEEIDELMKRIERSDHHSTLTSKTEELKEIVQMAVSNHSAFTAKYNDFDPEFSRKLVNISPNLVVAEIEFCMLLKLDFDTKEIARYTKVSVRTVEGRKYRIRKKLGILSTYDLNIWMNHL
ncbi:hypothetical protein [Pedobacter sp. V48]|uniref:tetratricopeptide repeat protein n=1 Tax=Pedobacter sp. V48 TaxID=509635 RepID=UPI0003E5098C|nr:hypothetical protein [Pedobacter sp. V48]ETZ20855.1 hypothetical protein N824_29650 [Pedobacter sp. V48]